MACQLSQKAGADYVKTSTGFSTGGATIEDVQLMRKTVGPDMGVKAAGGARSYADAVELCGSRCYPYRNINWRCDFKRRIG